MSSLFLGCFSFGLIFAVASFVLGAFGGGHELHALGMHGSSGGHGHTQGHAHGHVSPFNLSAGSAFLTWFGGAGYLLMRYSALTTLVVATLAATAGAVGALAVFVVIARFIMPRLTIMLPADYELRGMTARVTSSIRPGGTGEIVYTLGGSRHADGARSIDAEPLEKGTEVVIQRMEKGIAYVERWSKFADAHQLPPGEGGMA